VFFSSSFCDRVYGTVFCIAGTEMVEIAFYFRDNIVRNFSTVFFKLVKAWRKIFQNITSKQKIIYKQTHLPIKQVITKIQKFL
jgi:uncharacterized membrane protein